MRRSWCFIDASGQFTGRSFHGRASDLVANTPAGSTAIEVADAAGQFVALVTGEPIDTKAATTPTDPAVAAKAHRRQLLAASDWVVTRAAELNQPVPEPWLTYRAALRDITEQPGFPTEIEWPTPPGA